MFDDGAANKSIYANNDSNGASSNGGWIQTSPDDKYLYRAIVGRQKGTLSADDPGTTGGVYVLDIQKLVNAGDRIEDIQGRVDTKAKAQQGGGGDLPTVVGAAPINPGTPGAGPHWGAYDNFALGDDGFYHETTSPQHLAVSNYFVARSGLDGDHKVNLLNLGPDGKVSVDSNFRDEFTGQVGINFNRKSWPHGDFGNAKPHSELFVVADANVK